MKPSYDEPKIKPKNKINLENKNDKKSHQLKIKPQTIKQAGMEFLPGLCSQ
ncbi:hypothetical protein [Trabulsiella odontotermitis]|uniref:hypothetical protein n=1 Tax=Trabulsiella odontotermitis TaxID=379893 RepID=UPI000A6FD363|nr:hypothetical protein [Trabulsiella odontotermitis]